MFDDAQAMLQHIIENKLFRMKGMVGFYPANSIGDDIHIYCEDVYPRPDTPAAVLYGLRQQVKELNFKGRCFAIGGL